MLFDSIIDAVYRKAEYPAIDFQTEAWNISRPLEGLSILEATPVFRNTLVKYRALLAAGATLSFGISDVVQKDEKIVNWLHELGFNVVTPSTVNDQYDLVLDCAGQFAALTPRIGFVELTRSGVYKYEGASKPVYIADSGIIKRIETSLGTGDGYFRALSLLGYTDWKKKYFVVFGSGKVGRGIIAYALRYGAHVSVVTDTRIEDTNSLPQEIASVVDFRDIDSILSLVSQAHYVVSATGHVNALANEKIVKSIMHSKALVANMGVEDEFGPEIPASRVLNQKRPLNFLLEEPTHLMYIDATFALHNALAVKLVETTLPAGLWEPPPEIERELLEVTRDRGLIGDDLDFLLGKK